MDIRDLWVVPKRATRDADIGDVYGVELEGEDEDSEDEDLEQVQLAVAPLLTFVTPRLSPPPLLTLPRSWCFGMMWMRRC